MFGRNLICRRRLVAQAKLIISLRRSPPIFFPGLYGQQHCTICCSSPQSRIRVEFLCLPYSRAAIMKPDSVAAGGGSDVFQKLPEVVKPLHYEIHLKPDLTTFTFTGDADISLDILESTRNLQFNSRELTIDNAVFMQGEQEHKSLPVLYNTKWQHATITLPHAADPGQATLNLKFSGVLNDNSMAGFYRSKYIGQDGKEKYMATTQFEPPVSEVKNGDGTKTIKFEKTPVMSTYLLAFIVSELEYIEGNTKDGINVRIYTVPGRKDQADFALEVALKCIPFYSEFFGIQYVLPKCDLIAIPDFAMGAMENWGLLTFREITLLCDPKRTSAARKHYAAAVIAHEVAHMWFGNLVTMKWWTDLWLKEGFATFLMYYAVDHFYPEFDIWNTFLNTKALPGLELDALRNSHPIEVPINDPCEINAIYDSISYAKACTVIRMLHFYLGDKIFRKASATYLNKYKFSNAVTQDLWNVFSEISGQDINSLMKNWTQHMGYPVIKVSCRRDGSNKVLKLEQERFLADGSKVSKGEEVVWQVPITLVTGQDPEKVTKALLKEKAMELPLEGVPANQWVKLNANLAGFYRVEYSDDMLHELIGPVKAKQLSTTDRFNIVADLFTMVQAGRCPATKFLEFAYSLAEETELSVWTEVSGAISTLRNVLSRTEVLDSFDAFTRALYNNIGAKLGWDAQPGESPSVTQLRPQVLRKLGVAGDVPTIEEALKRFDAYFKEGAELPADIRTVVFALAIINRGEEAFDALVEEEKVRKQDLASLFAGLTCSKEGQELAWEFMKGNVAKFKQLYGDDLDSPQFRHVLNSAINGHCDENKAKEIEAFCEANYKLPSCERNIQQSLEKLRLNAALLQREKGSIAKWLSSKGF